MVGYTVIDLNYRVGSTVGFTFITYFTFDIDSNKVLRGCINYATLIDTDLIGSIKIDYFSPEAEIPG